MRMCTYVLGMEGDEKNQGQPPVPSLTQLGQTGILIRPGEYHCFIPLGKPNTHTSTHLHPHAHKVYRGRERHKSCVGVYSCQCTRNEPGYIKNLHVHIL